MMSRLKTVPNERTGATKTQLGHLSSTHPRPSSFGHDALKLVFMMVRDWPGATTGSESPPREQVCRGVRLTRKDS
jgi:hypothetical protein